MYGNFLGVLFYEWFAEFNVQVSRQLNVQDECRGIEGITFTCACMDLYCTADSVFTAGRDMYDSLLEDI